LHRLQCLLANQRNRTTRDLEAMNTMPQTGNGAASEDSPRVESREAHRLNDRSPSDSQVSLHRALRTLAAIRQRYKDGRDAHAGARWYRVHVVLNSGDVAWINATIEALEKAIAVAPSEFASLPAETHPKE